MQKIQTNTLTNANIYVGRNSLLGRASQLQLPNLEFAMVEQNLLGMIGTIETFAGINAMEVSITWNAYYPDVMRELGNPFRAVNMQARASLERWERGSIVEELPAVVFLTASAKSFPLGTFQQHENVEIEQTLNCTAVKLEINREPIFEFDALANILKLNGEDLRKQYRANLGI